MSLLVIRSFFPFACSFEVPKGVSSDILPTFYSKNLSRIYSESFGSSTDWLIRGFEERLAVCTQDMLDDFFGYSCKSSFGIQCKRSLFGNNSFRKSVNSTLKNFPRVISRNTFHLFMEKVPMRICPASFFDSSQ